jgi:hypothetical protein
VKPARLTLPKVEFDRIYNSDERLLERGSYLTQTATNMTRRLTEGEREYLEWVVAERKRRSA